MLLISNAQIPSDVKAYRGNWPNWPWERALVAAAMPRISPVPIVLIPETGKEKGLFISDVYILLRMGIAEAGVAIRRDSS